MPEVNDTGPFLLLFALQPTWFEKDCRVLNFELEAQKAEPVSLTWHEQV